MIHIDASRYSNTKKRTGVENYSYFLIKTLVKKHADEINLISPKRVDLNVEQTIIPLKRMWTHLRLSWEVLTNKKLQTLFVPSHVLPLIHPKKSIITLHDVAFKESPKSYGWLSRKYLNWSSQFAVKKAYKIITPSEKTRQDLIKWYDCDPQKIQVIPLGFEPNSIKIGAKKTEEILKKRQLKTKQYFLYLGRIEYKKNSDNLIKAFVQFSQKNSEFKLVMAGFIGHGGQAIIDAIPKEIRERIILPGYISEEEKQAFLQNAHTFIFPSRQEGFGIPLLEAMHFKLPIIASNIPTSKEIATENAHFFEPEDHQKLAQLMKKVTETSDPIAIKIDQHQKILKKYSWEKCAQETWKVLIA